jgi:hypothetical protein
MTNQSELHFWTDDAGGVHGDPLSVLIDGDLVYPVGEQRTWLANGGAQGPQRLLSVVVPADRAPASLAVAARSGGLVHVRVQHMTPYRWRIASYHARVVEHGQSGSTVRALLAGQATDFE